MFVWVELLLFAAVLLSRRLPATAADVENVRGLRRQRARTAARRGADAILDDEDVAFWTRLLVGDERGKETGIMSLPTVSRPPAAVADSSADGNALPRPASDAPTYDFALMTPPPNPTRRPTRRPTPAPTPELTAWPTPWPTTLAPAPDARRAALLAALGGVSSPDTLAAAGTPQRRALDWLADDDALRLAPDDPALVQRYALAVFYYATDGDAWNQCRAPAAFDAESVARADAACRLTTTNATAIFPNDVRGSNAWLSPASECTWGGLSCYRAGSANAYQVNVVEFEDNGLSGTLPAEMAQLSALRFFALERGTIAGPIPSSYGNLASLLLLDFDYNRLQGTLPPELWSLTNLRQLDLNDNRIRGELSGDIRRLRQLRFFQIDNNRMTGEIPTELGEVPNLSEFIFSCAQLNETCNLTAALFLPAQA